MARWMLAGSVAATLACGGSAPSGPPFTPELTVGTANDDGSTGGGPADGTAAASSDGGSTSPDDSATSHGSDDAIGDTTGVPGCSPADPEPPWIEPMQADLVARLSGATELAPGLTLSDRATPARRAATRDALVDELVELGLRPQLHEYDADAANVWVPIDATVATSEVVVFGAHFDTVPGSPGANDNATGVAVAMSLARWLAELPCRGRNVIVVFFDQEEIGLLGSDAFAAFLVDQDLDVLAAHTIDQMGWDADGDRTIELERPDAGLVRRYEAAAASLSQPVTIQPTQTGSTDHVSFRAWGIDAVGITEEFVSGDTTPHYHLPGDTFDTVDLAYLRSTTVLVHAVFGELVAMP